MAKTGTSPPPLPPNRSPGLKDPEEDPLPDDERLLFDLLLPTTSTLDKFAYLEPFRSGFQEIRGILITTGYYKIIRDGIRAKPAKNRGFLRPFKAQSGLASVENVQTRSRRTILTQLFHFRKVFKRPQRPTPYCVRLAEPRLTGQVERLCKLSCKQQKSTPRYEIKMDSYCESQSHQALWHVLAKPVCSFLHRKEEAVNLLRS